MPFFSMEEPLSVSGGVDMDDESLHARVEWMSLGDFRVGAEVVSHVYHPVVVWTCRSVECLLRPCDFAEDYASYYRCFATCVRDRFLNGAVTTPPAKARATVEYSGSARVVGTEVGVFGERALPHKGHRFAILVTAAGANIDLRGGD